LTASLNLRLRGKCNAVRIHELVQRLYAQGMPWGAWIVSNLSKYIGLRGLRWMARKSTSTWLGVFSNMGSWPPPGSRVDSEINSDLRWLIGAPVTSLFPVNVVSVSWYGKLGISLQLHPSLQCSLGDAQALTEHWARNLSEEVGRPMNPEIQAVPWHPLRLKLSFSNARLKSRAECGER